VFVVVGLVRSMAVPAVQVVEVALVVHSIVAAALAMHMHVRLMREVRRLGRIAAIG
jgi:hypothetical protein